MAIFPTMPSIDTQSEPTTAVAQVVTRVEYGVVAYRGLARSSLHISEFGGDFSVTDGEDVDAADVPRLAVAHLAIDP